MGFNIFEKKYQYIGLHLNMHALKMLQFDAHRSRTAIRAYTNATMPKGLMQSDTFLDRKKLTEFIAASVAHPQYGSFTTNRVIMSIPESKSFVRVIEMPAMPADQASNAIMFESEAYIPLPIDQVYFDWKVLSQKEKTMQVLLTASPKEYIDGFIDLIEKAGLKIAGIEVEAQSVTRALVPPTVEEPVIIVDMDAYNTALIIVENRVLQFTSTVPIAGNVFTEKLATELKITTEEAEKLKRQVGFANTVEHPNLKNAMAAGVEDLAAEIKNILKYHSEHSGTHVSQVLITGGGAKLQHMGELLPSLLESYSPLNITVANPLEHIPNLQNSPLTPYEALSFTTAIGLAMWGVIE